jgi:hypothetical protein
MSTERDACCYYATTRPKSCEVGMYQEGFQKRRQFTSAVKVEPCGFNWQ